MKRGRDNGQFLTRRFVLSEREGTLKYFTKYDVSIFDQNVLALIHIKDKYNLGVHKSRVTLDTPDLGN